MFDRATGQPVWPIEERPVAKGDVPGEWYTATQPSPRSQPAFDRQGFSIDDLIDFTPELRAEAVKLVSRYKIGPLYTPPVVSKWEGPLAMLMLPSAGGGTTGREGRRNPETGMLYVGSNTTPTAVGLIPADPARSDFRFASGRALAPAAQVVAGVDAVPAGPAEGGGGGGLNIQGLPLVKPPYGRITAYNMNKGEIAWQIAHGETPDNVRNHPALKGLTIPRTGRQGRLGTLVTKTLLVAGEGGFTTPSGQRGAMLRAYNKVTGKEAGEVYMPAPQTGSPMTYMLDGRRYIVVSISGAAYSGELARSDCRQRNSVSPRGLDASRTISLRNRRKPVVGRGCRTPGALDRTVRGAAGPRAGRTVRDCHVHQGLPLGVRAALQTLFGSQSLDIAEPGAAFQVTGAVVDPKLPIRRLVAAGCS